MLIREIRKITLTDFNDQTREWNAADYDHLTIHHEGQFVQVAAVQGATEHLHTVPAEHIYSSDVLLDLVEVEDAENVVELNNYEWVYE